MRKQSELSGEKIVTSEFIQFLPILEVLGSLAV